MIEIYKHESEDFALKPRSNIQILEDDKKNKWLLIIQLLQTYNNGKEYNWILVLFIREGEQAKKPLEKMIELMVLKIDICNVLFYWLSNVYECDSVQWEKTSVELWMRVFTFHLFGKNEKLGKEGKNGRNGFFPGPTRFYLFKCGGK